MPGAPKGNTNRVTHGVHSYLSLGKLPKGASYVRRLVGRMRAVVESETLNKYGEICSYHGALIQSACRHEVRATLLARWLRTETDLKVMDRVTLMREVSQATDFRDKCLEKLGIDQQRNRDWYTTALEAASKPATEPEA